MAQRGQSAISSEIVGQVGNLPPIINRLGPGVGRLSNREKVGRCQAEQREWAAPIDQRICCAGPGRANANPDGHRGSSEITGVAFRPYRLNAGLGLVESEVILGDDGHPQDVRLLK